MTLLGNFALWIGFLTALVGGGMAFLGRWRGRPELEVSAVRSAYAVCLAMVVASAALWKGLFTHDFNIEYVAAYTSRNLPTYYLVTAFWAGQKGSLLFWAVVPGHLRRPGAGPDRAIASRTSCPYVAGVTNITAAFFIATMLFGEGANPFERLSFTPADGRAQSAAAEPRDDRHPPMLYLGYISLTVPFAFAIAALLARRLDAGWITPSGSGPSSPGSSSRSASRSGCGGPTSNWGGAAYWAWDPVENASLLPWLTLTAFLHSVMIQEKRGMLKRWNMG
jgi:cytochrome c-type biogenesis protein CcmF